VNNKTFEDVAGFVALTQEEARLSIEVLKGTDLATLKREEAEPEHVSGRRSRARVSARGAGRLFCWPQHSSQIDSSVGVVGR
jgi:hypothetical protein